MWLPGGLRGIILRQYCSKPGEAGDNISYLLQIMHSAKAYSLLFQTTPGKPESRGFLIQEGFLLLSQK